jgi:hypothetical protein
VICVRPNIVNRLLFQENQEQVSKQRIEPIEFEFCLGKTESAKYVLQYLTESYGSHNGLIEDRINKCKISFDCIEIHLFGLF